MEHKIIDFKDFIEYSKYGLSFLGHGKASDLRIEEIPNSIQNKQKINTWFKKTTKDSIIVHHEDGVYSIDYTFLKTDNFMLMEKCLIFVEHDDRLYIFKIEEHKQSIDNFSNLYSKESLI